MIELERNKPVDTEDLSEFFGRCGWDEPAGATKLEWALAASHEWVVCRLEGELVGFARSCRLGPFDRVVFDAVVDPRFTHTTLRAEMVAVLAVTAGRFERVLGLWAAARGSAGAAARPRSVRAVLRSAGDARHVHSASPGHDARSRPSSPQPRSRQ